MSQKTELEKMINGEMYDASDKQLVEMRRNARKLTRIFNNHTEDEMDERTKILKELFGTTGKNIYIEPTFRCDYGSNIHVGENFYMNFNCVILDVAPVRIGDNCMCAPNVQIYTATHPVIAEERISGLEYAKPITIGHNVWLGGGCIICPGVTIGDNSTVAAGAVVVKNVPPNTVVGGNPAKVIKELPVPNK
jgi:maltose O-acetyltransferase